MQNLLSFHFSASGAFFGYLVVLVEFRHREDSDPGSDEDGESVDDAADVGQHVHAYKQRLLI